jgi:hypothetical protein
VPINPAIPLLQRQVPVRVDELQNKVYRERAPLSGCCGLAELLKLEGWTLVSKPPWRCLSLGHAKSSRWVTLRARWVTLRARWVTLRARWVTQRARGVTL